MNAVILEDEPLVAKDLQKLIGQLSPEITILTTLDSLQAARTWFGGHSEPDVLFCDIQLSDGVSFDLFNHVSIACPVIFTTAYNEYALRAFKLNSIDYLLKPVDREELGAALDKLKRWKLNNAVPDMTTHIAALLKDLASTDTAQRFKERFLVHSKGAMLLVDVSQVAYFLKDELIYLITLDGKRFVTDYESMEEIEDVMNPVQFFRANRQTIVHIQAVESFKTEYTGKLFITLKAPMNTATVDVSREKAGAFKKWLG